MMNSLVSAVLGAIFALSVNYSIKTMSHKVKTTSLKRVKKGLSSSEELARGLTGQKLNF